MRNELGETAKAHLLPGFIQFDEVDAPQEQVHSKFQDLQKKATARYGLEHCFPTFSCHDLLLGVECNNGGSGGPGSGELPARGMLRLLHAAPLALPPQPHLGCDPKLGTAGLEK